MPKRSAIAPAIGWPSPQSRFCSATASPNTSRPQPNSRLIGWTKKPSDERGPKLSNAIRPPQTMITSGVRQVASPEDGRRSPVAADIGLPPRQITPGLPDEGDGQLMQLHEKPKG